MKWALDGGALHLYDICGSLEEIGAGLETAQTHARSIGVAILYAEIFEGDSARTALEAFGFELDAQEVDVKARRVTQRLSFIKLVS